MHPTPLENLEPSFEAKLRERVENSPLIGERKMGDSSNAQEGSPQIISGGYEKDETHNR